MKITQNDTATNILLNQGVVLEKLTALVQKMHSDSIGNEVSFDCMPENLDQVHSVTDMMVGKQSEPLLGSFMCRKVADCREWMPEMPDFVGLFHAYTRGFNQDSRQHKLFIITSGGCNMISDHLFNMYLDTNEVSPSQSFVTPSVRSRTLIDFLVSPLQGHDCHGSL